MRSSLVGSLLALLIVPTAAAGQACLGVFSPDGSTALEGVFSTTEGRKTYGGRGIANVPGPFSVYATYDIAQFEDVNERGQKFGGGVAIELQVPKVSMCSVGGGSYFRIKFEDNTGSELTLGELVIPFGIAIGKVLPASERIAVLVFGQPEFQYIRSTARLEDEFGAETETDSQNEFGFHLGMRIGSDLFYGGGQVELSTVDDRDPVFSLVGAILVGD